MKPEKFEEITLPFRQANSKQLIKIKQLQDEKWIINQELNEIKAENKQLKDWVDRLLEYTNMSEADIKASIEKDKSIVDGAKAFNLLMSFGKMF